MIEYDMLKLQLPLHYVDVNTSSNEWKESGSMGAVCKLRVGSLKEKKARHYPHNSISAVRPGINYIEVDYTQRVVTIRITGKILPSSNKLINRETIWEAFEAVNNTGLIRIDLVEAYREALVLASDATQDHRMKYAPAHYTRCVSRYNTGRQYIEARSYAPNFQLQRTVKTARNARTLTAYDKHREAPQAGYHPNTLRLELRLTSFEMMRKYFGLGKGHILLSAALESSANPIAQVFDEVLKGIQLPVLHSIQAPDASPLTPREAAFSSQLTFDDKALFARLKELSFNLAPLQHELTGNKNAARKLKPYQELLTCWQAFTSDSSHDMELIRELMERIRNPNARNLLSVR
ncbi:hypothetical protein KBK19_18820 [Microvirga sp. STR05]|uniref:Uncharacterized protein n=1 Tax=Hymenobacter duratus TaxID=2771356 RepID=A0ABR8JQN1_9BACT|nr:hypothetical protein [Hymenobacter duratus]MBD2717104.1 hypothetical protein [Hymenobacter duratus]MBR7952020.1 hypothetical protein [Microvirga sp. STR05]